MKSKILTVILLFVFLFSFALPTMAKEVKNDSITINIPDSFKIIGIDNAEEFSGYLENRGFSLNSFKKYIEDNSVLVYATDTAACEIVISKHSFSFSSGISDLYYIKTEDIPEIFSDILINDKYSVTDYNNNRFIKCMYTGSDNGGDFFGVQLLTVKNGEVYTINYTVPKADDADDNTINALLKSFEVKSANSNAAQKLDSVIIYIIIIAIILLSVAVASYILYTFVLDFKSRKNENDVAPYVVIKRRKF